LAKKVGQVEERLREIFDLPLFFEVLDSISRNGSKGLVIRINSPLDATLVGRAVWNIRNKEELPLFGFGYPREEKYTQEEGCVREMLFHEYIG